MASAPVQPPATIFEFVGAGTASIRGPVSGKMYRFIRAGDRQRVDPRDASGLARSPVLRSIR